MNRESIVVGQLHVEHEEAIRARRVIQVDASGNPVAAAGAAYNYILSATDATYKFYGFASSTGWRFKRKTLATGVWEIASGTGDFDTAWADRAAKTYTYA